uniref:V-SNARE coiled-coil homology domain-containing protein n=1 Tax=Aureoumbra lagunensis TaxID=44058 RepID=A0A6S8EYM6_9STRA
MSASSAAPTSKKSLTETIRAAAKAAVKILDKKKKIAPAASWNQVVETLDDILTKRKARTAGAKKRLGSWLAKLAGQSTSEEATPTASSESEDQLSQPTATKITTTPNFASRAYRKSATDEQYRKELFGRAPEDSTPLSTKEKVEATTSDFDGLKDAMNERGERLTKLSDKAEELASASEEFEKMCARLNREKQRGTGWW